MANNPKELADTLPSEPAKPKVTLQEVDPKAIPHVENKEMRDPGYQKQMVNVMAGENKKVSVPAGQKITEVAPPTPNTKPWRMENGKDLNHDFGSLFEKDIPQNMRYKKWDINDKDELYWVTEEPYGNSDLAKFKDAMKKHGLNKGHVILRDDSPSYSYEEDIKSGKGHSIDLNPQPAAQSKDMYEIMREAYDNGEDVTEALRASGLANMPNGDLQGLAEAYEMARDRGSTHEQYLAAAGKSTAMNQGAMGPKELGLSIDEIKQGLTAYTDDQITEAWADVAFPSDYIGVDDDDNYHDYNTDTVITPEIMRDDIANWIANGEHTEDELFGNVSKPKEQLDIFDPEYGRSNGTPNFVNENDIKKLVDIYEKTLGSGDEYYQEIGFNALERIADLVGFTDQEVQTIESGTGEQIMDILRSKVGGNQQSQLSNGKPYDEQIKRAVEKTGKKGWEISYADMDDMALPPEATIEDIKRLYPEPSQNEQQPPVELTSQLEDAIHDFYGGEPNGYRVTNLGDGSYDLFNKELWDDKEANQDLVDELRSKGFNAQLEYDNDEEAYYISVKEGQPQKITKDSNLYDFMKEFSPEEFQTDQLRKDISLAQLWEEMKKGADVYQVASVDGQGFDSAVREKLFLGMEEQLGIPYDDIYEVWLHGPEALNKYDNNLVTFENLKSKSNLENLIAKKYKHDVYFDGHDLVNGDSGGGQTILNIGDGMSVNDIEKSVVAFYKDREHNEQQRQQDLQQYSKPQPNKTQEQSQPLGYEDAKALIKKNFGGDLTPEMYQEILKLGGK